MVIRRLYIWPASASLVTPSFILIYLTILCLRVFFSLVIFSLPDIETSPDYPLNRLQEKRRLYVWIDVSTFNMASLLSKTTLVHKKPSGCNFRADHTLA